MSPPGLLEAPSDSGNTLRAVTPETAVMAVVHPLPLSWATALIRSAGGPIPEYGSAAWLALPDDSRTKVAATVVAAERWRTRDYWADVHRLPLGRRAREIAEARRPRPGDHQGGPVLWERDEAASGD